MKSEVRTLADVFREEFNKINSSLSYDVSHFKAFIQSKYVSDLEMLISPYKSLDSALEAVKEKQSELSTKGKQDFMNK